MKKHVGEELLPKSRVGGGGVGCLGPGGVCTSARVKKISLWVVVETEEKGVDGESVHGAKRQKRTHMTRRCGTAQRWKKKKKKKQGVCRSGGEECSHREMRKETMRKMLSWGEGKPG